MKDQLILSGTERTLQEITDAARRNEPITPQELRYAVCAYDVFLSKVDLEQNVEQLQEFFIAAESIPLEYIGPANDPNDPNVVNWHKAFINVGTEEKQPPPNDNWCKGCDPDNCSGCGN